MSNFPYNIYTSYSTGLPRNTAPVVAINLDHPLLSTSWSESFSFSKCHAKRKVRCLEHVYIFCVSFVYLMYVYLIYVYLMYILCMYILSMYILCIFISGHEIFLM